MLAQDYVGASWNTWRAVIRAAEGLPLDDDQLLRFHAVAGREPPAHRVRELWVVAGRRAGKDSIAAAIASCAAIGDHRATLRRGERAVVMCLACDREQARIVLRYIAGHFHGIQALRKLIAREREDGLELRNGVDIVVATNSYRSVRGRTVICAILDEVAFWRDETSATPDFATYDALAPGLITLPAAMLIGISTPHRRSGLLFDRWRRYYGRTDDVLVVRGPSTAFNPTLPQSVIDAAIERDPEAAAAEWLAEWRSDLADFVDRRVVDAVVVPGRFELPPISGVRYAAFCDPSGGSSDSMALAVAHADADGRGVLDALREVRAPFSPAAVVAEFAAVLRSYGISEVHGDRYGGEWPAERFREHRIDYRAADRTKNEIYVDFLPLLNSGRIELLDSPRLIAQLCGLERRTARGGRDSIDHAPGAHDDCANAAAGVLVELSGSPHFPGAAIFELYRRRAEELATTAAPAPVAERCPHGATPGGCRQCLRQGRYAGIATVTQIGGST
ncbi:MAG TPA: hypothetical protein VMF05_05985 [Stellaceae bacterium]|nr:hypothetical protein [Stellaceae bacterium]